MNTNDSMCCERNSNISKFLNKYLHESLSLLPMLILIALFCSLKILVLSVGFHQNIIPYDIVEWK
jgi:hypothetical protein